MDNYNSACCWAFRLKNIRDFTGASAICYLGTTLAIAKGRSFDSPIRKDAIRARHISRIVKGVIPVDQVYFFFI